MELLTQRQQDLLHFITGAHASRRASPTIQEIATAFGICVSTTHKHVHVLRKKGYLDVSRYARRGIRPLQGRRAGKVRREWRGDFDRRVGEKLRGETELPRLFGIVREEVRAWLDVEKAELFVRDPRSRELKGEIFFGAHPTGTGDPAAGAADTVTREAMNRRKLALAPPAAALPLPGRDRVPGVLRIEDRRPGAVIDDVKLARLAIAAAAIAPVLDRGALDAELRRRIRLQSALVTLARSVHATDDFQAIVGQVYGIVADLMDAPFFHVVVRDDAGQWWLLMETDHADGQVVEDLKPKPVDPVSNATIRALKDRPWYILHRTPAEVKALEALGDRPAPGGYKPEGIVGKRSRSLLGVPLATGGERIGYISAQSYRYNAYSVQDAEDLILLGEYLGLVLQRAWRREKEREGMEKLRGVVAAFEGKADELGRAAVQVKGAIRAPLEALAKFIGEREAGRTGKATEGAETG